MILEEDFEQLLVAHLRRVIGHLHDLGVAGLIGANVLVGPRAIVGPDVIVENGTVLAADTEIADSIVGPETYVGEFTEVKHSLAWGNILINWQSNSCTHVPDAFLLSPLSQRAAPAREGHWLGRALALVVLTLTLPCACYAAVTLTSHFERLWLKAPIGLFSLADAEACAELFDQEARVLASFYALRADWRLDLTILSRVLGLRLSKRISFDNHP